MNELFQLKQTPLLPSNPNPIHITDVHVVYTELWLGLVRNFEKFHFLTPPYTVKMEKNLN